MTPSTSGITLALLGFVLGSVPFGYIAGRMKGIDLRKHGSKNIGANNTLRVLGTGPGVTVLILDALKGFVPVMAAKVMHLPSEWVVGAGIAAMLGHIFSPFLNFKGGKGVATGLGVVIGLSPLISGIAVVVFVLTVAITRYISLGSILGAITMAVLFLALPSALLPEDPLPYRIFAVVAAAFVVYRHKENIKRLRSGTESRFGEKKTQPPENV